MKVEIYDAVVIDRQQAFSERKERVLRESRGVCSPETLAAMEEELDSPCTAEMAACDKFALPVLRFPLLGEDVRGAALLRDAMGALPSEVSPA